jgi:hypothetical protein
MKYIEYLMQVDFGKHKLPKEGRKSANILGME